MRISTCFWAAACLLVASNVRAQVALSGTDPSKLLGISLAEFEAKFPGKCKHLKPMVKGNKAIETCTVKGRLGGYFAAEDLNGEMLTFVHGSLFFIDFSIKRGDASIQLAVNYGAPDSPVKVPDAAGMRSTTYGSPGSATTIDNYGKSMSAFKRWTRPSFTVTFSSTSYESWSDMTFEDTNMFAGIMRASGHGLERDTQHVIFAWRQSS